MPAQLMNLPIDIPWKLIAASSDMLDTNFCNKQFPFAWRSSMAISAYEPKPEDLPEELCDERLTYFKVTCSITGYQPSRAETELGHASFPDVPQEQLNRVLDEYFACYGVLLNVAVFPTPSMEALITEHCIPFDRLKIGGQYPNPCRIGDFTFVAKDRTENRSVDKYPHEVGDGKPELDLAKEMAITFPTAVKVKAKVVHYSQAVTMNAYRGNERVGSKKTGDERDTPYELIVEHDEINRVEFISPQDSAFLVDFRYYVREMVPRPFALEDLPRIIDFEPKTRDFYQAATESGEVLSASTSSLKTDKSFTNTESSETGVSLSASVSYGPATVSGGLTHKWGHTSADTYATQTDASRERRETQSTTTNLNQMYNLLNGYHPGTNRAVFLMLPRPHILQPTDRRTFVQGLRYIEGIQDFFLIVSRHKDLKGMCMEALLETGHFPSDWRPPEPPLEYKENYETFVATQIADGGVMSSDRVKIQDNPSSSYSIQSEWVIDRRPGKGDIGHPGIEQILPDGSNEQALRSLSAYDYKPVSDTAVQVTGTIQGSTGWDHGRASFSRQYKVLTRSVDPIPSTALLQTPFFLTSRGLCTCFRWEKNFLKVLSANTSGYGRAQEDSIVQESKILMNGALLTKDVVSQSRMPAMKELLRHIHCEMATSWRRPSRRAFGEVGFLDSDYFKERIKALLPNRVLGRTLKDIDGLPASVVRGLGEKCTVDEALKLDLYSLMRKTGLTACQAGQARRMMLGIKVQPEAPTEVEKGQSESPNKSDG